jgi:hypothetical protein
MWVDHLTYVHEHAQDWAAERARWRMDLQRRGLLPNVWQELQVE